MVYSFVGILILTFCSVSIVYCVEFILVFDSQMTYSKHLFHPVLAVSNIKNHISIVLEMENVQYVIWAELFKIHARSHKFIHPIIPPAKVKKKKKVPKLMRKMNFG